MVAADDGALLASVRGPGSNSHGPGGADASAAVIAELVERAEAPTPVDAAVFYLCGADMPGDVADLQRALGRFDLAQQSLVDNDTFALLRAGTDAADALAVVCGAGINCVGRASGGRTARYPGLGWETGDWGGGDTLGREALFLAARAEDGRGEPTALVEVVRSHFALATAVEVGEAFHYRRIPMARIGELAPGVVDAAEAGDAVARSLVERLADEIGLLVARAFRDLHIDAADVVLGGGVLRRGEGLLHDEVVRRLPSGARPVVLREAPVLGAALAALDLAGAAEEAKQRLRRELDAG